MKKITFSAILIAFSMFVNAQTLITQSVDPSTVNTGGVACWSSPSTGGSGLYRQNSFFRRFDLPNDFGITESFQVGALQFGQASAVEGTPVTLTLYIADSFPGGILIPLASEDITLSADNDNSVVEVPFEATIPPNSLVVFEILVPESDNGLDSYRFFPGFNSAGQNDPSYLQAVDCGISDPTNTSEISAADHYIMNLVEGELAVDTDYKSSVSLYPNPVNDKLNISLPNSIQIEKATMFDVLGKSTPVQVNSNQINTAHLASGIYILQLETNEGTLTKKIVKK